MVDQEKDGERLTAAECAARTGLTIRALRVYERYGLIAPSRAASGWRHYGRRELTRLNTVCVLKTAGLTLAQIRATLRHEDPPLQAILQAQIENWKTKKEEAERGRRIAESALQRLHAERALCVDELCELIRSHEMSDQNPAIHDLLQRIRGMPAQDRRAWAERHNEEVSPKWSRDFQEAVRTLIDPELEALMDAGVPPCAPEVQKLVVLHLDLMTRYRIREATVEWLTREDSQDEPRINDVVPQFRQKIVRRILPRLKQRPTESSDVISNQWTSNPFLVGYFSEAELRSVQCMEVDAMVREVRQTLAGRIQSASREAGAVAERFGKICSEYALGDPLKYAQWAALARPPPSDVTEAEDKAIWEFIAERIVDARTSGVRSA